MGARGFPFGASVPERPSKCVMTDSSIERLGRCRSTAGCLLGIDDTQSAFNEADRSSFRAQYALRERARVAPGRGLVSLRGLAEWSRFRGSLQWAMLRLSQSGGQAPGYSESERAAPFTDGSAFRATWPTVLAQRGLPVTVGAGQMRGSGARASADTSPSGASAAARPAGSASAVPDRWPARRGSLMKPAEEDRPKGWRSRTAGRLPDTHPAPYRQGEPETPFRRAKRHGLLVFVLTDARGRLIRVSGARPRHTSEISLPSVAVFPSGPAGRRIEVFNLGRAGGRTAKSVA